MENSQRDAPGPNALSATALIDSDHPSVMALAQRVATQGDARERAVALYYAVRDEVRYDPYRIDLELEGMRASRALESGNGWCVTKAALLAAAARAIGIPARVGYADVRNHLSTERMRKMLATDVFIWHGYTELWLNGAWIKATPAFNIELCERFGLMPLEFDGRSDSLYHPFDREGRRHMEYLNDRGSFDDVPLDRIAGDFAQTYPSWTPGTLKSSSFDQDVSREVR
jgi:transglutaminase-like putative cysteine protease